MRALVEKTFSINPDFQNLSELRKGIREFLGEVGSSIQRSRIVFCIDELVSNIIEHGNLAKPEDLIKIHFLSYPSFWKIILTDSARQFDPNLILSQSLDELYESGADGGFGLRTVKKLAKLYYKRLETNNQNQLILFFRKGQNE